MKRGGGKRALGVAIFGLILVGAFETFYLRIFQIDRARYAETLVDLPYRKAPGLRQFLIEVRARTQRGEKIVIWTPRLAWWEGYDYVYSRSHYILAGRAVLPLVAEKKEPASQEILLPVNLQAADVIAGWRVVPAVPGFEVVWRGADGVVLRRKG